MFSKVHSAQNVLLKARIISIEIDLSKGLNAFSIVGLPDKAVEESKDRVAAAIKNSGFTSPKTKNQKVIVSLAPADLKKEGPTFDLGIALGYLIAAEEIKFSPKNKLFLGELSLDGKLCGVKGVLPLVAEAKKKGFEELYLPYENAEEAALIDGIKIYGAKTLKEVIDHLNEKKDRKLEERPSTGVDAQPVDPLVKISVQPRTPIKINIDRGESDLDDIKGQETAKRGLEIAAAGGHNVAMYGPPGTGKTMLAKAFASILPPLSFEDILEITSIHSIAGALTEPLIVRAPFRSPHHTSSHVSLVGGGTNPRPGEITLAHKGVLFMDEFPEFDKRVMESLRQPLEEKIISVSRAKTTAIFPADFILIAAMNPCPCGNFGIKGKECICAPIQIHRYQRKVSGPIIDRIDLWLEVSRVDYEKLSEAKKSNQSQNIKKRVENARSFQKKRFDSLGLSIKINSQMSSRNIINSVKLEENLLQKYNQIAQKLDLSARSYHRVLKVARTIADLSQNEKIKEAHLLEALQYRHKNQTAY